MSPNSTSGASSTQNNTGDCLIISPQFSVHVVGDRRVLLLSEQRSFALTGRPYVALVPLLDGTRNREMLVAELASKVSETRVNEMLDRMIEKGYARKRGAMPLDEQAFWIECDRDPTAVDTSLSDTRVAVKSLGRMEGSDRVAAARLASLLEESGVALAPELEADITVVLVDDYLTPGLSKMNRDTREANRRWLPIKPRGRTQWIGPLFHPERAPCWDCLQRSLLENRQGEQWIDSTDAPSRTAKAATPASLVVALGFTAQQVAALATGDPSLDEDVLTLDLGLNEIRRHRVRSVAGCPVCGPSQQPGGDRAFRPIVIRSPNPATPANPGWRARSLDEASARLEPLVSPITGIVSNISEKTEIPGASVVTAYQKQSSAPGSSKYIWRPAGAAGVGETLLQARVGCLAEAAERYSCCWTGTEPRRLARLSELGQDAIDPRELLQFSPRQFEGREAWNDAHGDFNQVPLPFEETWAIEWSPVWSLTQKRTKWVPSRLLYFNYEGNESSGDHEFCYGDSNGCAIGGTLPEAIFHAALELIERDACALFWYNRVRRPKLDLDAFATPYITRLRQTLAQRGRDFYLLDLTSDLDIPAFMAVSPRHDGSRIMVALGAHLDPRLAISRAAGELSIFMSNDFDDDSLKAEGEKDVTDWVRHATLSSEGYLVPTEEAPRTPADYDLPDPMPAEAAVEICVSRIERAGIEVLALDMTRPDVGLACARVLAPGLRHFWARFAPGRLYDTPVALGWLDRPTPEQDLNPRPFFL